VSQLDSKASSYARERDGAHEGAQRAAGRRFALVAARFNDDIVARLVTGARQALREAGATDGSVELFRCPGAMELAGLARRVADTGRFDGVVCLGAVIRGGTPHFDYVCDAVTAGLTRVALDARTPVGNGVLTCDTLEQARDRCGLDGSHEDKGWEAVVAALDTALVLRALRETAGQRH